VKYLIVISGATASGKTSLGIQLAQHYQTVIVSADSRQFYREMQIGTAKPNADELAAAPHYLINSLSIHDEYSIGQFERDSIQLLDKLFQKHDIVVMVGGSGMYIKAVCEGLDHFPEVPKAVREELIQLYNDKGIEYLQAELKKSDSVYYNQVDLNNPQRIMRALEVCRTTGQPFSAFRTANKAKRNFKNIKIAIDWDREILYERINKRVDLMLEAGLEAEAKTFAPLQHLNALQTVGYREWFDYFNEKIDQTEAIRLIKRNTRRYAKRQMTWLRRENEVVYFKPSELKNIIPAIDQWIEKE